MTEQRGPIPPLTPTPIVHPRSLNPKPRHIVPRRQKEWWKSIPLAQDPSKLPQLPTEVWERALDELDVQPESSHPNRMKTFHACALTCRGWVPRSRYHLFKEIKVRSREEVSQVSDALRSIPALRTRVKKLVVLGERDKKESMSWVDRVGFHLGPKLKALEEIHIYNVEFPPTGSQFYKFWSQFNRAWQPGGMRVIKIEKCMVVHLNQLVRLAFMTKAEEVEATNLVRSPDQRPGPPPVLPSGVVLPLRELLVDTPGKDLLHSVQWHTLARRCSSLSKVKAKVLFMGRASPLPSLPPHVGTTPKRHGIGVASGNPTPRGWVDEVWPGAMPRHLQSAEYLDYILTGSERLFLISIFDMFRCMQRRNATNNVTLTNICRWDTVQMSTKPRNQPGYGPSPAQPQVSHPHRELVLVPKLNVDPVRLLASFFTHFGDTMVPGATNSPVCFHDISIKLDPSHKTGPTSFLPLDKILSRLHATAPNAHISIQDSACKGCALPWARKCFPQFTQLSPNAFCDPVASWLCDFHPAVSIN